MKIFTTFPIVAALDRAAGKFVAELVNEEAGLNQRLPLIWQVHNSVQADLLAKDLWWPTVNGLDKLTAQELAWVASWDAKDVNNFLHREEFDIQLDPWPLDRKTFGIAGLIKLLLHWTQPGSKGYIVADGKKAFRLDQGLHYFETGFGVGVAIPTREGDWVHIVPAPALTVSNFELLRYAMQTTWEATDFFGDKKEPSYTGVILPQWSFQQEVDVTGLIGLSTTDAADNHWRLVQALMQGKSAFGLDGTSFKAAFAAAAKRESCMSKMEPGPGDLVVDWPLVMSIWKPGVHLPLGAVMVEPEEFADEDVVVENR